MGPKRRVRPLVQEERKNIPQLKYGKEKEKNVFVRGDSWLIKKQRQYGNNYS
jgi:hypothetical protein